MCCLSVGEPGGLRGTCFIMFQASFCFPAASLQAPYLHSEDDPPSRKKAHLQPGLGLCKGFNGQGPAWQTQHIFVTKTNRLGRLSHSLSRHTASYETQNETKRKHVVSAGPRRFFRHVVWQSLHQEIGWAASAGREMASRAGAVTVRRCTVSTAIATPSQRHRNATTPCISVSQRCHHSHHSVMGKRNRWEQCQDTQLRDNGRPHANL